ncbi:hypothetical protein [Streptomyces sp. NPDC051572]|uniref:hypothetical protein n=1 Tax=Streptomyces sp. NPDC051572 TaxID=3155802 RepID=UPI00344FD9EF
MALDLHLDGVQLAADIARIENSKDQLRGVLLSAEVDRGRGRINVQALGRSSPESFRTEWLESDAGKELFSRAQQLIGRLVRVYKYIDTFQEEGGGSGQGATHKMRLFVHLVDLGPADGQLPENDAKDMVVQAVGGDKERAARAWQSAGLPASGPVAQGLLEAALSRLAAGSESDDNGQN